MGYRTAAIVVTYNRKELLKQNIDCLLNQRPEVPDIIVVDNHSSDGTKDAIDHYITTAKIQYCNTGSNLGGAGGFSFGIRYALELGYDYFWIMDDDCMPQQEALAALFKADRELHGQYGFLSSKTLWIDGSLCAMNLQRKTVTKRIQNFDSPLQEVAVASFVSLFLQKKIVLKVGLPIKEFFIWTDDWEYTRRISKDYPCFAVAESVVIHKTKMNVGSDISRDDISRLPLYAYAYRNEIYFYRREGIRGFFYEAVRLPIHMLRVLLNSKDHKLERLRTILNGTVSGLFFYPEIEYADRDNNV